ncbi:sporulation protein [Mechercharimyces sp. CAU 1602]|uniref:sporulation protein n=1 Tax=Mechercharimyces sp. CAU 1602 TaxID=2973933 RepID=UPI002163281B|nr:sporulation protein [Mechercharimyces sp. CAU 1602]MCS1352068.1 sporulation protein [Mechercharimyces sp. CAU 1602]
MFKTMLASLGIGAAKIDLVLDQDHVTMGEEVTGEIRLQGGEVEQRMEYLSVHFCVQSHFSMGDQVMNVDERVDTIPIVKSPFTVQASEEQTFPFSFICPEYLPVSSINTKYYFLTNLEIEKGMDAKDRDYINVLPAGLLKNFMDGFTRLGFRHIGEGYTGRRHGSAQIIQFYPTEWLKGKYDEIVFNFQPGATQSRIEGFFELDKRTAGLEGYLADKLDLDEKKGRFAFTADQLATVEKAEATIRQFIIDNSKGLIGI